MRLLGGNALKTTACQPLQRLIAPSVPLEFIYTKYSLGCKETPAQNRLKSESVKSDLDLLQKRIHRAADFQLFPPLNRFAHYCNTSDCL